MKRLAFALLALWAAGCGAATSVPGSSGESPTPVQATVSREVEEPDLSPPPIFLISAGGKQRATQGSSCVNYVNEATGEGVAGCGDVGEPLVPEQVTVAAPGERVVVAIPGATLKKNSALTVQQLGCDVTVEKLDLPATGELHWPIDLDPGAYELDISALFEAEDGVSGDVSGTLGLVVDDSKAPSLVPLDRSLAVCPFGA
jgi:hypothetical protein